MIWIWLPFLAAGGVGFLLNSLIFPSTALLIPFKRSDWRRLADRLINENLKCYWKILAFMDLLHNLFFDFLAGCIWIITLNVLLRNLLEISLLVPFCTISVSQRFWVVYNLVACTTSWAMSPIIGTLLCFHVDFPST